MSRSNDLYGSCTKLTESNCRYINDILRKTRASVDQVIIEPNGEFHTTDANASPKRNGEQTSSEEDDDLLEIRTMPRIAAVKGEISAISKTPPESSREHSVMTSNSGKRAIGQVIDLTFSSDEEEEPPRAPKRKLNPPYSMTLSRYPSSENIPPRLKDTGQTKQMHIRPSATFDFNP